MMQRMRSEMVHYYCAIFQAQDAAPEIHAMNTYLRDHLTYMYICAHGTSDIYIYIHEKKNIAKDYETLSPCMINIYFRYSNCTTSFIICVV